MKEITIIEEIPLELNDKSPLEFLEQLHGPTLFVLKGASEKNLFISGLLHGNEPTGYLVLFDLMKKLLSGELISQFSLLLFLGNVKAAKEGQKFSQRYLDSQEDFNRIWNDKDHPLVCEMDTLLKKYSVLGALDLHNNSGSNPVYSVFTHKNQEILDLANFLTDKHLFYENPRVLTSYFFRKGIPSLTIECGKRLTQEADQAGISMIQKFIMFFENKLNNTQIHVSPGKIYGNPCAVKIKEKINFSTTGDDCELNIIPDLEDFNFKVMTSGTSFARTKLLDCPLEVLKNDKNVTSDWLFLKDNEIVSKKKTVILMATTDVLNIKKDCLMYFAEELTDI